jgi:hypothetical protein
MAPASNIIVRSHVPYRYPATIPAKLPDAISRPPVTDQASEPQRR